MAIALSPQEQAVQQVILHGVSWETCERLLADVDESHAAYFAYDQGVLEIRVPSAKHEQGGAYVAREESVVFPRLTREVLSHFMEESKQQERTSWLRSIRAWVRQLSGSEA